ncbi:uncharacterized protein [Macrobrachium rosenbergii]|uniref:uncharacterized protein isoform X1 n=1 Tax=Macrobrachium rosenbergii TaxID=79674 RepID=UPI0034D5C5C5
MATKGIRSYFLIPAAFVLVSLVYLYALQMPLGTHMSPKPRSAIEMAEEDSPHYLLNTAGCTIPDIDPNHPSVVSYKSKKALVLVCSKNRPLTEDSGLSLLYYEERLSDYKVPKKEVYCYYEGVERKQQQPGKYNRKCDSQWKIKTKIPITKKETPIPEDGILVTCVDKRRNNTAFYNNAHFFIQPRRATQKRKAFKEKHGERSDEQLSVIFLGTDAVSRGNLRRHMPKTFQYLRENLHVIDLQGFNKVADNTDPNLTAYLMGISYDELKSHKCTKASSTRYDDCPLIWKDYEKKGYVTVNAEDSPWMSTFHFNKAGFCKQPTDYYNRPYFYASDSTIGHSAGLKGYNGKLCQGARSSISLIHEYSLKIAEEFRDIPYFATYWTASVTHDYLTSAVMADDPSLQYLKKLQAGGYLNHTVLFFVSDHGLRWGSFRSTYAGMLEERMPYITMAFPKWFKERYPEAMKNLRTNTRRLTASYDVYATLRDILDGSYADPAASKTKTPFAISLFKEIPRSRTCEDAGVPDHYCACEDSTVADPNDPHLWEAAKATVNDINESLQIFPECIQLSLDRVLLGRIGTARNATTPEKLDTIATTYLVTFVTKPGGAVMESTLKYHGGKYELTSDVSRVNKYGNQSHCIVDDIVRKYCYCKDMLT